MVALLIPLLPTLHETVCDSCVVVLAFMHVHSLQSTWGLCLTEERMRSLGLHGTSSRE